MRKDFQKLLTECYKKDRGGAMTSKAIRTKIKRSKGDEDGEFGSSNLPRRKIIGWNHKSFGENLNPLERFVGKQVGKKWDKVYSEICKHNSKSGAVGLHIFQHLFDFIETKVEKLEDGRIIDLSSGYHWELNYGDIYVDPDDGIIKKYKKGKKEKRKPREVTSYQIGPDRTIEKMNGVWYLFEWAETPEEKTRYSYGPPGRQYDHFVYVSVKCYYRNISVSRKTHKTYAKVKKQLNHSELQMLGVSNDPANAA